MEFREEEYLDRFKNILISNNLEEFYNDPILFHKISHLDMHFEQLSGSKIYYKNNNVTVELQYGNNCHLGNTETMYRLYCEQNWDNDSSCFKITIT